jgi:hypothetical protein
MSERIVNSWNEWDELEEMVVGIADYACFEPKEPGNHPKLRDQKLAEIIPFPGGAKSLEVLDKANEELNGLVNLLKSQNVIVRRYDSWEALFTETQLPYIIEAGIPENDVKGIIVFKVSPPADCLYFQHKTAMIPIIIKE